MSAPFTLAHQATVGFADAAHYDKHRPTYPPVAVERLLGYLNVLGMEHGRLIDLASGTGKFTEALAARPEDFEIIAIEPHPGMREALEKKRLGSRVKIVSGNAATMPLEAEWADGLVAAQAFHWFATTESLQEIHRVLRPGASFGMIWNIEDYNAPQAWQATTRWEQRLKDILKRLDDGHPRFRDMVWKEVFEQQQDSTPVQMMRDTLTNHMPQLSLPLGEENIRWTVWLNDEAIWHRYSTLSQVAVLNENERSQVKEEVLNALQGEGTERNDRGEVALHGVTYLAWTSRI